MDIVVNVQWLRDYGSVGIPHTTMHVSTAQLILEQNHVMVPKLEHLTVASQLQYPLQQHFLLGDAANQLTLWGPFCIDYTERVIAFGFCMANRFLKHALDSNNPTAKKNKKNKNDISYDHNDHNHTFVLPELIARDNHGQYA